MNAAASRPVNRLSAEASPYLRQHADNPVDWYPWGPEALARAKAEGKPILLSIGYSACHWCHVMARESFENEAIARQMNEAFVSIKVDREERPDLDHLYQLVVQLMGRSGGWPLTGFLTPDQRPFYAGTYFPPEDRHGMPGLPAVLARVEEAYRSDRAGVERQAREITEAIARSLGVASRSAAARPLGPDLLALASRALLRRFDDRHGGFGGSPKFPSTMCLDVLLRRGAAEGDAAAARSVTLALDGMRRGGIWDHLGGGFHRYSTDERWLVPHFEKMLSDNALLLRLYTDAFRAFGDEAYAATARDLGRYLLDRMQSPSGGFYSSEDADSEGEEGEYFVWTPDEVREALTGDELAAEAALRYFGVTEVGNFGRGGASVLAENRPVAAVASALSAPLDAVAGALARATARMYAARERRPRPFRDEKILASLNGLAIGALADASLALGEPELLAAAVRAFADVAQRLVQAGRVARLAMGDDVKTAGFLDDHAYLAAAALDLYEATGEPTYVDHARAIAGQILALFWDEARGVFFFTPSDGEALIARVEDPFDQSIPSGASIASLILLKLAALADESCERSARRYLEGLAPAAMDDPFAFGQAIGVLDRLVRGPTDVVIIGRREIPAARALHEVVFGCYLPNRNVVWVDPDRPESVSAARALAAGLPSSPLPAAYVCRDRSCSPAVVTPDALAALLAPA